MKRGPILTDGAWGTELQARGLAPGDFPDVWNLSHPERVVEVAPAYVEGQRGPDEHLRNYYQAAGASFLATHSSSASSQSGAGSGSRVRPRLF